MTNLEELARKAAKGDREAFGEIYRSLVASIYSYLYWNLGSREEAEDLAEEVFLRCLVNMGNYNPQRGSFKAWAFRIARNLMVDHQRRRKRRPVQEFKEMIDDKGPSPQEKAEEVERANAIKESLEELTAMQRQVITMKFYAGMSNADTAAVLGRKEGAINALQHRALRRMGKSLVEKGWR